MHYHFRYCYSYSIYYLLFVYYDHFLTHLYLNLNNLITINIIIIMFILHILHILSIIFDRS